MIVTGQYLGVSEEGTPLVGVLLQGSGKSAVKWFTPQTEDKFRDWAGQFTPGDRVECSLVLEEREQRMILVDMQRKEAGSR
jgi:hypothetical protein